MKRLWNKIKGYWRNHGTKILASGQALIASLAGINGLIPPAHLPYWMAVGAVLLFIRGFPGLTINGGKQ